METKQTKNECFAVVAADQRVCGWGASSGDCGWLYACVCELLAPSWLQCTGGSGDALDTVFVQLRMSQFELNTSDETADPWVRRLRRAGCVGCEIWAADVHQM